MVRSEVTEVDRCDQNAGTTVEQSETGSGVVLML